jgi:hypothetical protein
MLVGVRMTVTALISNCKSSVRIVSFRAGLVLALSLASAPLLLTGCKSASAGTTVATASPQVVESARQKLDLIPPPSKTRYLAVHNLAGWENPYLTMEENGAMLHVMSAQRQDETVRVSDLPAALNSLPEDSWPYGRVVAVEETHNEPTAARPAVRRNVEAALKTLSDLGVVAYEWNEGGLR